MFLIRKLGRVLGQMERMSVSEAAMLKQVRPAGLRAGVWAPGWDAHRKGVVVTAL